MNAVVAKCYIPLSYDEISAVTKSIRVHENVDHMNGDTITQLRFVAVSLKEPNKVEIIKLLAADVVEEDVVLPQRQADVVTLNPQTGLASEFVVDLLTSLAGEEATATTIEAKVVSKKVLDAGVQPMFTPDDLFMVEEMIHNSSEVAAALKERYNITDMKQSVVCDPWSMNMACDEDWEYTKWRSDIPARLVQVFMYHRQYGVDMEDNHYAHPIDIVPIIDINANHIVSIEGLDRNNPVPSIPTTSVQYHRNLLPTNTYTEKAFRTSVLNPLDVIQPDGPSFTVDEATNVVSWQKWSIQVGFNYREGLVLHNITYDNRPICSRASLVEMAVPYADISKETGRRKCAFDVGDYGLGYCANSLELGCDCLGHIYYFDGVLPNAHGEPIVKKKVICMHEEDQGILWKHVEYRNGHNESRRSRELVISSIATVVNYEYLFYFRFKQDGSIDFNIKLSGELSTNLLSSNEVLNNNSEPTHGVMVAPDVNAQIHQHMFCARLDMNVDGFDNVVSEVDVVPVPFDPIKNPWGNAFVATESLFEKEQDAIRVADATKARVWKIANASKKNPINNKAIAYKLVPFTRGPAQPVLLTDPKCIVSTKGAFANANLWVTPYTMDQRYPAGEYTPQGTGADGLPSWTSQNRSLLPSGTEGSNGGLVLWHAFGVCHVPRIEDFPVMPCEITGFTLKPDNFFVGNPSVDLQPEHNCASRLATSTSGNNGSSCCHGEAAEQ